MKIQWEYKFVAETYLGPKDRIEWLNSFGLDGWELVQIYISGKEMAATFKRVKDV